MSKPLKIVGLAVILVVGGCAPVEGDASSEPDGNAFQVRAEQYVAPHVIEKDITVWSLPTDVLLAHKLQLLEAEAESTLTKKCMDDAGQAAYRISTNADAPNPETSPGGIHRIFTADLAKKYGYREAPDPRYLIYDLTISDPGYESQAPAFHDAWHGCIQKAQEMIRVAEGKDAPSVMPEEESSMDSSPLEELHEAFNRMAVNETVEPLRSSAQQWQDCMASLGIADLPSSPWNSFTARSMPPSLVEKWQWMPWGEPSAEEVQIAVHDAQCREKSGWQENLYNAQWQNAVELLSGKEDLIAAEQENQRQKAAIMLALREK